MKEAKNTIVKRRARVLRARGKVKSHTDRPRLLVFRSNKYIYAQIIDKEGKVVAAQSSMKSKTGKSSAAATEVGSNIGKLAKENKVTQVAFDRRGYKYHGRVKAVADAARAEGLQF